ESAVPPTQALHALRARCHKTLGEEAAARAALQRARQGGATTALDHFARGQTAYQAGRSAEALGAFEAALRLGPAYYWAMMYLGYCRSDRGRPPEDLAGAARVFSGCILNQRAHAHAYYWRANAYYRMPRYQEAAADYSTAIRLDPEFARAWRNRGVVFRKLG